MNSRAGSASLTAHSDAYSCAPVPCASAHPIAVCPYAAKRYSSTRANGPLATIRLAPDVSSSSRSTPESPITDIRPTNNDSKPIASRFPWPPRQRLTSNALIQSARQQGHALRSGLVRRGTSDKVLAFPSDDGMSTAQGIRGDPFSEWPTIRTEQEHTTNKSRCLAAAAVSDPFVCDRRSVNVLSSLSRTITDSRSLPRTDRGPSSRPNNPSVMARAIFWIPRSNSTAK